MDINIELYKIFEQVASSGSFSEAAKNLYVSQSAVSQAIKTLESKLGTPLFIRTTKKITLTPAGETLLEHIQPAIRLIKQGEHRLTQENSLENGSLHIGASDTICRYFLLSYLQDFHRKHPNVSIKITNQTSPRCVELLATGQVDCIIVNTPNSHLKPEFISKVVGSFQDVFIAGKGFEHLKNREVPLKEMSKYPIMTLDRKSTTSEFLHHLFMEHHLELSPELEAGSNDLLLDLARIDLGIAFVPDYCVPKKTHNLFKVKIAEHLPKRHITAAYSSLLPPSPVVKEFLDGLPSQN